MKDKIVKFFSVTLFSASILLLLGSVPHTQKNAEIIDIKEFTNINSSASNILAEDFDNIIQKNPAILLEISVE